MQQQKVVKGKWHTLSNAEKFFTIVIVLSITSGFGMLAMKASGLAMLTRFLG